ncbi:DUF222 domain-containing protein [Kibdelosporangium phytohabitans]|uniref:DUF222 domain-containing protein n=1 Tax=Kibdelosporangium phytohabitans TaxID=860235 RepID=A0A0N9HUK3_9PSEU|nr:DUF222 domain-containing protein [Kibdelosporangium phytohabitans]ALG07214.1 hypothetical protein AOZ06_10030 [Kibdelosporangium phytohabitans]MBE1471937.1 hypothetical protein [Kibdelosporangium phytohabitans]
MTQTTPEAEIITAIQAAEKRQNFWQAMQIRDLAKLAECRPPDRPGIQLADGTPEELAAPMNMSIRVATKRILEAEHIVRRLPATLQALQDGVIDTARLRATYQITKDLSDDDALTVEKAVLSHGAHASYQEYRRALRRQAMKVDPEAAERKRKQRLEQRDVVTRKSEDGSAKLVATMLAGEAESAYNVLNHLAHKAKTPDDTRTLAQRRADALIDLVLGNDRQRVRATINVTVPLSTLIGLNDEPGELTEYGPITAEQCRELARDGVLRRLVTDDFGHLLDVSPNRYASEGLAERIRMRDRTCRQPGCRVPGRKCRVHTSKRASRRRRHRDRDYRLLCKRHQLMYQRTKGWIVAQPEPDRLIFVTPTAQVREAVAERYEEPAA